VQLFHSVWDGTNVCYEFNVSFDFYGNHWSRSRSQINRSDANWLKLGFQLPIFLSAGRLLVTEPNQLLYTEDTEMIIYEFVVR